MARKARYVDRPILLRAIAEITRNEPASATRIADRLRIPAADARLLALDEVQDGFLVAYQVRTTEHRYVAYRLTERGASALGVAA
jgi:hypothetical protein